ncbi:MAG: serine hydrolase [Bacteroidota bacterium]
MKVPSYLYFASIALLSVIIFASYKPVPDKNNLLAPAISKFETATTVNQVRLQDFDLIKPLLYTDNTEEDPELIAVKSKLDEMIHDGVSRGDISNGSVYLKKMNDTRNIRLNSDETYNPGSMMKLPVMIAYFKEAENEKQLLNKNILFQGHNNNLPDEEGAVSQLIPGNFYSVRNLIEHMIIESDNDAMGLLISNIPEAKMIKMFSELNIPVPASSQGNFRITAEMYSRFLRVLYNATYLDRNYSQLALSILSKSNYKKGLTRTIDRKIKVAHKYGISMTGNSRTLSEAGIFYTNDPYLFVIMTKGNDYTKLADFISECSSAVYNSIPTPN